jgi:hypothetical protein
MASSQRACSLSINASSYRFNESVPDISAMACVFNFRLLMGLDIIKRTSKIQDQRFCVRCISSLSNLKTSNILFLTQQLHTYPFRDEGIPLVCNMPTTDGSCNEWIATVRTVSKHTWVIRQICTKLEVKEVNRRDNFGGIDFDGRIILMWITN